MAMWIANAKLAAKCAATAGIAHFTNSTPLTAPTTAGWAADRA